MHEVFYQYINELLNERKEKGIYRSLKVLEGLIDFTSNDYLGLSSDEYYQYLIEEEHRTHLKIHHNSVGSRLLSGNSYYTERLEEKLSVFFNSESALLFNSGYAANYSLLSTLPYKNDFIFYDEYIHASAIDGIRASKATAFSFQHNNPNELEQLLKSYEGKKYVVVESIYSMDGDTAPLLKLAEMCEQFGAALIVDEAHATGLHGDFGSGLCEELQILDKIFARINTFGKAYGAHGAVVLCKDPLKNFLINYARPLIYSTALPLHAQVTISVILENYSKWKEKIDELHTKIKYFKSLLNEEVLSKFIRSNSAIQCLIEPGNNNVRKLSNYLQSKGFDIRPIVSPTVPENKERIRIVLHSYNKTEDIELLCKTLNEYYK